jgi:hypothetical protein
MIECNFHGDTGKLYLRASSSRTVGALLRIKIGDEGSILIFTGDQVYTDALIKAINSVPRPVPQTEMEEEEAAP